ncbi:MAG TPA: hypothetical protein VJS92_10340 [Candidatus Polarisedimenticolaceae bacterium]|nr:hypothetical protein [Candidatus Polarisedimenticolaceae bacterium]
MNAKRTRAMGLVLGLVLGSAAIAAYAASGQWVHVRVDGDDQQVHVNIPIALVESLLPLVEEQAFHGDRPRLELGGLQGVDARYLRNVLSALRDTPDQTFVTVRDHGDRVRVAKERGFLLVHAEEQDGDRVHVRVPMNVVEALVPEDGQELDLRAALRRLAQVGSGDLVSVESSDGDTVHIWIDGNESGERD